MSRAAEFYEALAKDKAMRERAKSLDSAGEEYKKALAGAVVAFAKEEGYSFTEEELKDFMDSKELSDGDLKAVAGGIKFTKILDKIFSGK
ncbi:MAG: Nif11-like leader peptide family RiPP precursor [Spirochaetaceae bacterium]|jgi:predicted ribosomally synthesized peptide with nif11-like leader|nr:Nif11-like leader peptide family RiPP precursor [Spirochaetaceae bacterium]